MDDRERFRPFTHDSATSIRLQGPQLAGVICQVRWPQLTSMAGDLKPRALALGDGLATVFPLYAEAQEVSFTISPEGVVPNQGDTVYRWSSADSVWQASLTRRSVSLLCALYPGYDEFATRLRTVLEAVHERLAVPLIDRIGLRYVNHFSAPAIVADPGQFFDSSVLGYAGLPLVDDQVRLTSGLNQAAFSVHDVTLQARSGFLLPGQSFDPSLSPVEQPSWVVDLDAFIEHQRRSTIEADLATVGRLADTAYDFFKLVAKPGLVRLLGGDPS